MAVAWVRFRSYFLRWQSRNRFCIRARLRKLLGFCRASLANTTSWPLTVGSSRNWPLAESNLRKFWPQWGQIRHSIRRPLRLQTAISGLATSYFTALAGIALAYYF